MIIFHEGMPRSGKSYASTKDHIVPALKKGRTIYARLDGVNFIQLAELAEITEERCRELLIEITEEQMAKIWELPIPKDSLVVLDELQNYWPQNRAALSPPMMKFIAEHGHHGWDILAMGQLLKDCHRNWINRTNRKIQFVKKDMLGKPNEYKWIMYTGRPDKNGQVKFDEVAKGDGTYEEKYFGCYASHSAGTENAETYVDDRVNIFKTPLFRKWLPILGVALVAALGYVGYLFNGGLAEPKKTTTAKAETASSAKPLSAVTETYIDGKLVTRTTEGKTKEEPEEKRASVQEWPDPVLDNSKDKRIRVALVLRTAKETRVLIEWRDDGMQIYDQLSSEQLKILGWSVLVGADDQTVLLNKGDKRMFATAWPVSQPIAKSTDGQQQQIKAESKMMGQAPGPLAFVQ